MAAVSVEPIEPVELSVGDLLLRPWREDDVGALLAAMLDPALRRWNDATARTAEDVRPMLARRMDWSAGDHCAWAVTQDADLVGSVSLQAIDRAQGDAEIGYWTMAAARGRGVAGRAVDAVCNWAFPVLQLDRVQLFHAVDNPASGRVAAKAGFLLEGRLRRSHRYGDGVRHDELLWSRLADDPPPPRH